MTWRYEKTVEFEIIKWRKTTSATNVLYWAIGNYSDLEFNYLLSFRIFNSVEFYHLISIKIESKSNTKFY